MFSAANAENVVNPPQKPTVKKSRHSLLKKFPFSEIPKISPIKKHPTTFTTKVPKGNEDGNNDTK